MYFIISSSQQPHEPWGSYFYYLHFQQRFSDVRGVLPIPWLISREPRISDEIFVGIK